MAKFLLFTLSIFAAVHLSAQIEYVDYGESWLISMDANEFVDLDADGTIDFKINTEEGKLGFLPVNLTGCFRSESGVSYNNIGTRELEILEEGDLVQISDFNLFDYIDGDKTAIYDENEGFAEGWSNMEDQYVGFAIVGQGYVYNGWMKIAINEEAKGMYIKEIAYTQNDVIGSGGIVVGDKGITSVPNLNNVLNEIEVSPNPAVDQVQLRYDYQGTDVLSISLQSPTGQEMARFAGTKGVATLNIPLYEYSAGAYFIRFETEEGVHVEKIMLTK